jgi:hypothetical protein
LMKCLIVLQEQWQAVVWAAWAAVVEVSNGSY